MESEADKTRWFRSDLCVTCADTLLGGHNRDGYLKSQGKARKDPNKRLSTSATPPSLQVFFPENPSVWESQLQAAAQMQIIWGGRVGVSNKACSGLEMLSPGSSGRLAATCCPRAGGGRLHTPGATSGLWEQEGGMGASLL